MLVSPGGLRADPLIHEVQDMRTNHVIAALAATALGLGGATLGAAQAPPPGGAQAPGAGAYGDRPGLRGGMPPGRGGHGARGPGDGPMARMATELGLSDAQKQQMRALRESARPEGRAVAERLRTSQRKLRGLSPDDPAWNASVEEASRLAADAATRRVQEGARMRAEMWRILTPEQRSQFAALQAQREQQMQQRMEDRERRRPNRPPEGRG
jgi:protein CpxP